jgi:hypothetical protein
MAMVKIDMKFEPEVLANTTRSEITAKLTVSSESEKEHWCECDITVSPPLSLAPDKTLNLGRTRIGILKKGKKPLEKTVKIYMAPHMAKHDYLVNVTAYLYDEDGAIAERMDTSQAIRCEIAPIT